MTDYLLAQQVSLPVFETAYRLPSLLVPPAGWRGWEWIDSGLLLLMLLLTAYLALVRRSRLGLWLVALVGMGYFGFFRVGCVCPVGSVQNVTRACVAGGAALPWVVVLFFALPLLASLLFGRVFCAGVCPLGAIQELVAIRPIRVPMVLDVPLRLGCYLVLGLAVTYAATGGMFLVCRYDPFIGFFRFSGTVTMLSAGVVILVLGMFVARPYCRYLCPYGVLLGWMSLLSRRHVQITPDVCVQCQLCEQACPVNAILPPDSRLSRVDIARRRRWMLLLLILLPVLMAVGGMVGWWMSDLIAGGHRVVADAESVVWMQQAGRKVNIKDMGPYDSEQALMAAAAAVQARMVLPAVGLGVWMGLSIGLVLLGQGVGGHPTDWRIDRLRCVSCGRCFASCPRHHAVAGTVELSEAESEP